MCETLGELSMLRRLPGELFHYLINEWMWNFKLALLTLSPDWSLAVFLQSRYLTVLLAEGEWHLSSPTPRLASPQWASPFLLPMLFTPSVLPVRSLTHSLLTLPPEWRVLVVAFMKQLLASLFPHPAPITVIISTVSQSTPCTPQSRCPTLMGPAGLCW